MAIEKQIEKYPDIQSLLNIQTSIREEEKEYNRTEMRNNKKRSGSYSLKGYRAVVENILIIKDLYTAYMDRIGWRAYVTNVPKTALSYSRVYLYYRKTQYVIEVGFHLLKSVPVGIRPFHVWHEDQIKGLMRFLSLSVIFLKMMALELMLRIKESQDSLIGLTAGQPKRKTNTPTARSVLNYFYRKHIKMNHIKIEGKEYSITSTLPELSVKILDLLGLEEQVYTDLVQAYSGLKN